VGVGEKGRIGVFDGESAGHAEVEGGCTLIENQENLLSAAADGLQRTANKLLRQSERGGLEDIAAEELDARDGKAKQVWPQGSDDGFDFGQFGHATFPGREHRKRNAGR